MKKPVPAQKKCSRCGMVKPASEFYRRQNGSLNSPCIECLLGHPPKKSAREGFKICSRCGIEKPVEEFRLHHGHPSNPCKSCGREYYKTWRKVNPEKRKEITARTYDPARQRDRRRTWETNTRQAHAEGLLPTPQEKLCSKCGKIKPREEFYLSRGAKSGLTARCKDCFYLARKNEQGVKLYQVDFEDLEKQTREASGIVDWVLEDKDLEGADQRAARLGEEG